MPWPLFQDGSTLAADPQVLQAWRADPEPFWVLAVLLDSPEVLRRRAEVAAGVRAAGWLAATTPGQAHVTVLACGARRPVLAPVPVELLVGGADSFATAVFLHAGGPELVAARTAAVHLVPEEDPWHTWVPHVTVGTYLAAVPRSKVAAALEPWRGAPVLQTTGVLAVHRVDRRTGALVPG
jgi:hypothetical protein